MPGWLIQGVRGEGKSLAAVYKIREYLRRGCPVATNLDLWIDEMLPADSDAVAYRLPDKPRLVDFEMIGAAYDPKYKGEDKNGLLVLDELGTWLNSRSWSDKERAGLLNWLFLSRKKHWDIILLAQDHEMIDKQAKSTLCDFLVQASRRDRQRVPFVGGLLQLFGHSGKFARKHVYDVFYGFSMLGNPPQEKWQFTGNDLFDAYDTNQVFEDGTEVLEVDGTARLVDMRATYQHLPPNRLSGDFYRKPFLKRLEQLTEIFKGHAMANKGHSVDTTKAKIVILLVVGVAFVAYRLWDGVELPGAHPVELITTAQAATTAPAKGLDSAGGSTSGFVDRLVTQYKPRLGAYVYSSSRGSFGTIQFYEGGKLMDRFTITQLKGFGVSVIDRPYGVDIVTAVQTIQVTAWPVPKEFKTEKIIFDGKNEENV